MNRNTRVDGSKKGVSDAHEGEELIMEYDPFSPKGISGYNLESEDSLEVHVKPNLGKHVEFVPFLGSRNSSGDCDESEQDLDEELTEEIEIASLAPKNYGTDSEKSKKNPEDVEGELSDERKTDSPEVSFAPHVSFHSRQLSQLIEGQTKIMSGKEFWPKSSSDLSGQISSNEKKRPQKLEALEPGKLQPFQLRKKGRYEDMVKPASTVGDASEELTGETVSKVISNSDESISKQEEHSGSFGKRRRTRWSPEHDVATVEDDSSKRRKTRWACDDSLLKMLGPISLPDFMRDSSLSELDPEVKQLKMKLMEINRRLQSSVLHDDRPEAERSPSPEPVYNNLGIRMNTHKVRLRKKLTDERASIICMLVKKNPTFKTPPKLKPNKFLKKIYVPVKEYPTYNFVGLIIGPRGNTQKKMEKETGAKISLRGKGSVKSSKKPGPFYNDDLHVYVEADNQKSLDAAVVMIEKLLIPVADGENNHKKAQLAELAKLNATYRSENICNIRREEGHKEYACPGRKSTLNGIACNSCGSFCHLVSDCPLFASSQKCQPSWRSSEDCIGFTPNMNRNSIRGIDVTNLYVGYLSRTMESKRLRELFLPFRKISDAKMIKDRSTGLSKGYGFVKFENPTDAAAAVAHLNGYKMDGKALAVRVAGHLAPEDYSPLSNDAPSSGHMASSSMQCQAACFALPAASMLPQTQPGSTNDEKMFCPCSSICSWQEMRCSKSAAHDFPPSVGSRCTSSTASSNQCPNEILHASKFPSSDPMYPGSRFHSYFTNPVVECFPNIMLDPGTEN